jgi:hypothetical protein
MEPEDLGSSSRSVDLATRHFQSAPDVPAGDLVQ